MEDISVTPEWLLQRAVNTNDQYLMNLTMLYIDTCVVGTALNKNDNGEKLIQEFILIKDITDEKLVKHIVQGIINTKYMIISLNNNEFLFKVIQLGLFEFEDSIKAHLNFED